MRKQWRPDIAQPSPCPCGDCGGFVVGDDAEDAARARRVVCRRVSVVRLDNTLARAAPPFSPCLLVAWDSLIVHSAASSSVFGTLSVRIGDGDNGPDDSPPNESDDVFRLVPRGPFDAVVIVITDAPLVLVTVDRRRGDADVGRVATPAQDSKGSLSHISAWPQYGSSLCGVGDGDAVPDGVWLAVQKASDSAVGRLQGSTARPHNSTRFPQEAPSEVPDVFTPPEVRGDELEGDAVARWIKHTTAEGPKLTCCGAQGAEPFEAVGQRYQSIDA